MNTQEIYTGLKYSTSEINMNFKIKVHTVNKYGRNINMLVGVAGLVRLIGVEMTNKLLDRSFASADDKCICKLRRGVRVTFYAQ